MRLEEEEEAEEGEVKDEGSVGGGVGFQDWSVSPSSRWPYPWLPDGRSWSELPVRCLSQVLERRKHQNPTLRC